MITKFTIVSFARLGGDKEGNQCYVRCDNGVPDVPELVSACCRRWNAEG